ncbi:hypothetical protein KCP78_22145 [Salmonella enterica subsp. enterica]|nr:hypothetical protein KCP78_22145 [Salmonella enterica subsp. enterica]
MKTLPVERRTPSGPASAPSGRRHRYHAGQSASPARCSVLAIAAGITWAETRCH